MSDFQLNLDLVISKSEIKKGMILADYGCGSGIFTRKIAGIVGPSGIVYGVDVMKDVLVNLQKICNLSGINNIKTIWSDLERYGVTNISTDSVDVGFIINTFSQSNKELDFIKEVARMIKKGGKIVVVDWTDNAVSMIAPLAKDRTGLDKIKRIAKETGVLKEISNFVPGNNYYGIVFEKIK